ncbi:MAG: VanZ family protein [Akkermansiaceae bacterium]|nr:VanZ family protein [Akkermansiaceae bacterium]
MLRRIGIACGFVLLVAALVSLWTFRFEAVEDHPVWTLADLESEVHEAPSLRWERSERGPSVFLGHGRNGRGRACLLRIPGMPAVDFIRLRCRLTAHHLTPGPEDWQDGRLIVEWHEAGASSPDLDPVAGVKYGLTIGDVEWVLHPLDGPSVPMLRLGHLGKSGEMELSDLEIVVLRETILWKFGKWLLAVAWIGWLYSAFRIWPGIPRGRVFAAALLVLFLAVKLMVPGPWRSLRGLLVPFETTTPAVFSAMPAPASHSPEAAPVSSTSGDVPALGKLADQGDFVLKVKMYAKKARPLLHLALLTLPALALMFLLGPRPGIWTAAAVALSIEASQTMFGYGFGWDDVGDLACDALGILLAFWIWKKWMVARPGPDRT